MDANTVVQRLSERPELAEAVVQLFENEWPAYYGQGGAANAQDDVRGYARAGGLPMGMVATLGYALCGFAALKIQPFPNHSHLGPWIGAAVVVPRLRGRGIGNELFAALEREAQSQHVKRVYCATGTAVSLLQRREWRLLERVLHDGRAVSIFEKEML